MPKERHHPRPVSAGAARGGHSIGSRVRMLLTSIDRADLPLRLLPAQRVRDPAAPAETGDAAKAKGPPGAAEGSLEAKIAALKAVLPDATADSAAAARGARAPGPAETGFETAPPAGDLQVMAEPALAEGPARQAVATGGDGQRSDAALRLSEIDMPIDEDRLRDLVADLVREELAGTLGERLTRSLRRMVRREVARTLAARSFD